MRAANSKAGGARCVKLRPVAESAKVGLIVRDGEFFAGGRVEGGRLRQVSSIKDLPRGVWMTNMKWDETRSFERQPAVLMQSGSWLHIPWNELLEEWNIEPRKQVRMSSLLARAVARVADLVLKTSNAMGLGGKFGQTRSDRILEHSSLSQGVRRELEARLSESFPREKQLCAPAKDLQLVGMRRPIRRGRPGVRAVTAKIPPFSHLLNIASRPVPIPGIWFSCSLPENEPVAGGDVLAGLLSLGRPVICEGVFRSGENSVPSWLAAWIAGSDPVFGRRHFSLEEIEAMAPHGEFVLHAAYAGSGWRSPEESIASLFSAALAGICGGGDVARSSWSAGAAAEVLLCAAMSLFPNSRDCPSLETSWISLADRIAMIPAIEAAESSGAELASACAGRLRLRLPGGASDLVDVANSLWRAGAVLLGARSDCIAGRFGGSRQDELYARALLGSSRKAAWLLDCVLDAPFDSRRERFDAAKTSAMRMLGL